MTNLYKPSSYTKIKQAMKEEKEKTMDNWEKRFDENFIAGGCDNHGSITVAGLDGEAEQEQCQFCDEYLIPIKQFIAEEIEEAKKEAVRELISYGITGQLFENI